MSRQPHLARVAERELAFGRQLQDDRRGEHLGDAANATASSGDIGVCFRTFAEPAE